MALEKYNFSNDYQDLIIACLVNEPRHFRTAMHLVQPEFFDGRAAFDTVYELKNFWDTWGQIPGFTVLANEAHTRFARENPDHAKALFDYVGNLKEIDTRAWESVRKNMLKFAKERAVHVAIKKLIVAAETGKAVTEDPVKLVEDAVRIADDADDMGIEIHEDIDYVIDHLQDQTVGVRTGYPLLDRPWLFGWQPGWLIVPLAPPKRYKTTFCINLALNIAGEGFGRAADVIYYACEIDQIHAMKRALINITGMSESQMYNAFGKFRNEARRSVDELVIGRVLFKSFPSKSATLSEIHRHAKDCISILGMRPKAIVIDYAETVRPTMVDKNTPEYRRSAEVYTEARAIGQNLACVVIMPDRCKAEVVERAVPNLNAFQGSFEKAGIVDAAIGLCATDEEKAIGKMRYFVFINRHGPEYGYYEGTVKPDIALMTIDHEIEFKPEEEETGDDQPTGGRVKRKKRRPGTNPKPRTRDSDVVNSK